MSELFSVYILTNQSNSVLYVGMTNNLERRLLEHRRKIDLGSFTARYNCNKLVYFESGNSTIGAIEREKQIKKYRSEKKIVLIESMNPYWKDLSENWYQ